MFVQHDLRSPLADRHPHVFAATHVYAEGTIDDAGLQCIASRLAAIQSSPDRVCVLFGYGSQPPALYTELRHTPGVEVLWSAPMLPFFALPLSLFAASCGGLVSVRTNEAIRTVLPALAAEAMVELYSFTASLLPAVRSHVKWRRWRSRIGRIIGRDPGYFCFGVDGSWDNPPAWYSFGPSCPSELQRVCEGC